MRSWSYEKVAASCAFVLGAGGVGYALAFIALLRHGGDAAALTTGLFLFIGGLLTVAVLVAVYERVKQTDAAFALLALFLGAAGGIGSAMHGAEGVAALANAPSGGCVSGCISPTDPRGLATFGLLALSLALISYLIARGAPLPRGLANLGFLAAALLLIIYIGRVTIYDPTNKFLLFIALLTGFIVNPLWYTWVGMSLWRGSTSTMRA